MKFSFGIKIRLLLLALGLCLVVTSLSLSYFSTPAEVLRNEGEIVQKNFSQKKNIVDNFIKNRRQVEAAKGFDRDPNSALDFLNSYRDRNGINLLVYETGKLRFWSFTKVDNIHPESIKEGNSVLYFSNEWYNITKKTEGEFTLIFLIGLQTNYSFQGNRYFNNRISSFLSASEYITIASFNDKEIYPIKDNENRFLFGIKQTHEPLRDSQSASRIWLFFGGVLCVCTFMYSLCYLIAKRGYLLTASTILLLFFVFLRIGDMYFGWINYFFNIKLFDPKIYAQAFLIPSLGDLLLNIVAITWWLIFVYNHRSQYKFPQKISNSTLFGVIFHVLMLLLLGALPFIADELFSGLIYNSRINFDIVNVASLDGNSWISFTILCFFWLQIYMITCIILEIGKKLRIVTKDLFAIFSSLFCALFVYKLFTDFTISFILYALAFFTFAFFFYTRNKIIPLWAVVMIFICLSVNSSIKYAEFKDLRERTLREQLITNLQESDDPNAITLIGILEKQILDDKAIFSYFHNSPQISPIILENHIKGYVDEYLKKYEFKLYSYNNRSDQKGKQSPIELLRYKALIRAGSIKIDGSNFFYKVINTFGNLDYFGVIPIIQKDQLLGTIVVDLQSRQLTYNNQSRNLFSGKDYYAQALKDYSVAFYGKNKLLVQSGPYSYPVYGDFFKGKLRETVMNHNSFQHFNHLVFVPDVTKKIVVSKQKTGYIEHLATLSFFFILFIIFSTILSGLMWLISYLENDRFSLFSANRKLIINSNKILYRTRIQLSIVLTVVITLLLVGWITYKYASFEYRAEINEQTKQKISKVQFDFQRLTNKLDMISVDEKSLTSLNNLAEENNTIINLYDINGNMIMTTYPKIYEYGIVGGKISPKPYIYLKLLKGTIYINPAEVMGSLTYSTAFMPVRNTESQILGFIGLSNYNVESEYDTKLAFFLSRLINIYALIFVAVGALAVFLAKQITNPLTSIQQNMMRKIIGKKNTPLLWKRDDEIGSLIKEYNNLILRLEENANRLATSEREKAWREMAKQVSHEIKNPLTPLKLGVQLLEKSWNAKDPAFEVKLAKFSRSFIEQIDQLSDIASEFSNFAKMSETRLQKTNLVSVIEDTVSSLNEESSLRISYHNQSDRDLMILGDSNQLFLSLTNLLKNALKPDETLESEISIGIITFSKGLRAHIEIKYYNSKFLLNDFERIFSKDFPAENSASGIGLIFARQAINNMNGDISISTDTSQIVTLHINFQM
jgi:two-component system nitrogen regulation sensor histidine kinase NtrY